MSSLKEIRRRITSVKNTKQITRAMKLVSAAKLRRAQEAAIGSRNFGAKLAEALRPILAALPRGFQHPLLGSSRNEVGKRRIILIAGERGLCGPYNTNVVKAIQAQEIGSGRELEFVAIGRRAVAATKRFGWKTVGTYEGLPEDPGKWPIEEIIGKTLADFESGECTDVVMYYTKFISAMTQQVASETLLPLSLDRIATAGNKEESPAGAQLDSKFDVAPVVFFQTLAPVYIRAKLREAGLESKASEHAARMTAMDSATSNASDLIDRLRLYYNRARQSAITTELIDIVGGAEAVK